MFINKNSFIEPVHFSVPAPWAGHIPFSSWLISQIKPSIFVELGAYSGISYMAICQAIKEVGCETRAWAIDTWQGDQHAGAYGEEIFDNFKNAHDVANNKFSSYLRMTFDEAVEKFNDNSIDLLHIDGLHTYEAVAHDFYTWLPKLTNRAVVLFHDTHVFRDDFGVHKLWDELTKKYPSFEFNHSNGLGVLLVGEKQPDVLVQLANCINSREVQEIYERIGSRFELKANFLTQQNSIKELQSLYDREEKAGTVRHNWIVKQDILIAKINEENTHLKNEVELLKNNLNAKTKNAGFDSDVLLDELAMYKKRYSDLLKSKSWKITKPVRLIGRIVRGGWSDALNLIGFDKLRKKYLQFFSRIIKVIKYLVRADFSGLIERVKFHRSERALCASQKKLINNEYLTVSVIAPGHTKFVAKLISERLNFHGFNSTVQDKMPMTFSDDLYIVLCPQVFQKLPPGEKRIVYQMEQSVSSRWFDEKYFKILENSLAVLDYSLKNIDFLSGRKVAYPHVTYLPIGAIKGYGDNIPPSIDSAEILFYGDSLSSQRRQRMLAALSEHYKVKVVNDLFGDEMISHIKSARVVINLHYYENALLEMPRIQECLSLGIPVVSESSQDQNEYPELDGAVIFFEEGSISGMIDAVRLALDDGHLNIKKSVSKSSLKFDFMFDRFLISMGVLPSTYVNKMTLPLQGGGDMYGLSMPETIARRKLFLNVKPKNCLVFDGIRRKPGWVGCGLSYAALARHAKTNNMATLTVMEDDVILPTDFDCKLESINRFLSSKQGGWDVFSGVIAVLNPDAQVIDVEDFEGQRFVTINKMISMVFNIYARSTIDIFANWNPDNLNAENNTIDKYLESQKNIKVVTTLPFLVGHREEVHSTLWGFQNTTYVEMIANSQTLLEAKVAEFLAKQ